MNTESAVVFAKTAWSTNLGGWPLLALILGRVGLELIGGNYASVQADLKREDILMP